MGIPFFYRQIISRDQKNLISNVGGCDRLFLDFNSIIHVCAGTVLSKRCDENLEKVIFDEIFNHTMMLCDICPPSELLYLAIDGVAPRSKMQQQRKRRFLSAYRNDMVNNFKTNNNIKFTKWDSNAITPGTVFMSNLLLFLKEKMKSIHKFKVIVSGADEEGEGEQKIFEFMKKEALGGVNVIYGLDADLIMLSLCCPHGGNIYLMREGQNFFNHMTDFKYLNITALRKSVSKYLYESDDAKYMYDYVFICFLLGNDFLPNLSCLKIKSGAIDVLCDLYKNIYAIVQENLVRNVNGVFTINYEFFIIFLEALSKVEEVLMQSVTKQFYESTPHMKTQFISNLEKFTHELDEYPQVNKFPYVINPILDSTWKNSYYHHLFGSNTNDTVKLICENYIEGLIWTCNYYFNGTFDKLWFYKYNYAPCVSDMYKYAKQMSSLSALEKQLRITKGVAIKPCIQLLLVLPPSSKDLVCNESKKIMEELENGCVHYYPVSFCLTSYLKSHLWECSPVIPIIDLDKVLRAYEKLTTK